MALEFLHIEAKRTYPKCIYTEEFKAKRRAIYAARHADDPMTEHRMRLIKAQKKRERAGLKYGELTKLKEAKAQAIQDIQEYLISQEKPFMYVHDLFNKDVQEYFTTQEHIDFTY